MCPIGQSDTRNQNRTITLFRGELGYSRLGDWADRSNSNEDWDY